MEYASVTVQLTIEDIVAFSSFNAKERKGKWRPFVLVGLAAMAFSGSYILSARRGPGTLAERGFHWGFLSVALAGLFLVTLSRFWARRKFRSESYWRKTNPALFAPNLYQVLDEGLYLENDRGQFLTRWAAITRIVESAKHFYVMETRAVGHSFPKRCFSTPEAAANFADQVRFQIEKHAAAPGATA